MTGSKKGDYAKVVFTPDPFRYAHHQALDGLTGQVLQAEKDMVQVDFELTNPGSHIGAWWFDPCELVKVGRLDMRISSIVSKLMSESESAFNVGDKVVVNCPHDIYLHKATGTIKAIVQGQIHVNFMPEITLIVAKEHLRRVHPAFDAHAVVSKLLNQ